MTARGPTANRRGLTLMELMVSMAVLAVVMALGLQLEFQTQRAMDREQAKAARLGSEADLLSLLRRDVRAAAAIGPRSTEARLVLVAADGRRVEYRVTPAGVERMGPEPAAGLLAGVEGVRPRFSYPAAAGRVVRVSWGEGAAARSITLHLRNRGTL
ncbi:MAG: prepilin-type N-terminal cleavage/methylation domain-containing protein [Armatimonadetes bacterium]|nr:prepilin-type N-terminal cleavage/methylation domain-containing protein [Armatimonadota bacterium]